MASSIGGATCCQAAHLLNDPSEFDDRIAYILHRGGLDVLNIDIVGEALTDRTAFGRCPRITPG